MMKTSIKKVTDPDQISSGNERDQEQLESLFHDALKDIYWAEKHLVRSLPKLEKASTTGELKAVLGEHLEVTRIHVERLEEIFEILGYRPQARKCEAMEGLSREAENLVEETASGTASRDIGIIMAAQKIEHYEIATYSSLCQLAITLGHEEVADMLATTLGEEKDADETLTGIAENNIRIGTAVETEE